MEPGEPEVLSFEVWILQSSTEKYLPAFLGIEGCSVSLPRCRSPLGEATLVVHARADPLERWLARRRWKEQSTSAGPLLPLRELRHGRFGTNTRTCSRPWPTRSPTLTATTFVRQPAGIKALALLSKSFSSIGANRLSQCALSALDARRKPKPRPARTAHKAFAPESASGHEFQEHRITHYSD